MIDFALTADHRRTAKFLSPSYNGFLGKGVRLLLLVPAIFAGGCLTAVQPGTTGQLSGKLIVQWAGENRFAYLPDARDPLTFITSDGKRIVPERMYTDGGSIPPIFWGLRGFSPWGYGPAYIIHDWLFEQHHCQYDGWQNISFDDSARILGEVIDTLIAKGDVPPNSQARVLIEQGVRTSIARKLWDSPDSCEPKPSFGPSSTRTGPVILRINLTPH